MHAARQGLDRLLGLSGQTRSSARTAPSRLRTAASQGGYEQGTSTAESQPHAILPSVWWLAMTRRTTPTPEQLDRVFIGPNAFSECPESDRVTLRAVLDRHLQQLTVRTLHATGLKVANESGQRGSLYCVLKGRVSLEWKNAAGRSFAYAQYDEGEVFGELGSGLLDLPPVNFGLEACSIPSRTARTADVLECPDSVVAQFRTCAQFERPLVQQALRDSFNAAALGFLRHDSKLAVAHCCISPRCGTAIQLHPTLHYLGERVAVRKTISLDELSRLAGLALNAVRPALRALKKAGYVGVVRSRSTQITVVQVEALLEAVTNRSFT